MLIAAGLALGASLLVLAWHRSEDDAPDVEVPGCGNGPTTPGIDVSYHQDTIQWAKVRKAGIRFAFIRVSDGTTFEDPRFSANWDGARSARIVRGAYQFFRPEESAIKQADMLIAAIARDPGELPPAIDVEVSGGRTRPQVTTAIRVWVDRVRARLGVEPIVYTSPELWGDLTGNADLSTQPLWIAHYTTGCPRVPPEWSAWTFWQHSKSGTVPGIKGPVDLDVFNGDSDALRRLR
ncbi:MAG: GH25 family lysozyme [Kofleriaceae bacterium]|nr:GH25 family lysozyme [Kofleriaceae bacterium]